MSPQPDVIPDRFWEQAAKWLWAGVAVLLGVVHRANEKRSDKQDAEIAKQFGEVWKEVRTKANAEQLMVTLEKIDRRLDGQDLALDERVTVAEYTRVRDGVRELFKKIEAMGIASANQHGESMLAQAVLRNEIQQEMNKQTNELREAMRDMVAGVVRGKP